MDNLKNRAAPKHTELIRALAEQQKTQIEQHAQNEIIITLLQELVSIEKGRSEHDVLTHEQWQDAKKKAARSSWMQVVIGVAALTVAVITFWSGAAVINKDNVIVQGLMGLFL